MIASTEMRATFWFACNIPGETFELNLCPKSKVEVCAARRPQEGAVLNPTLSSRARISKRRVLESGSRHHEQIQNLKSGRMLLARYTRIVAFTQLRRHYFAHAPGRRRHCFWSSRTVSMGL